MLILFLGVSASVSEGPNLSRFPCIQHEPHLYLQLELFPHFIEFTAPSARSIFNQKRYMMSCQSRLKLLVNSIRPNGTDHYVRISSSESSLLCYPISLLILYSASNLVLTFFPVATRIDEVNYSLFLVNESSFIQSTLQSLSTELK